MNFNKISFESQLELDHRHDTRCGQLRGTRPDRSGRRNNPLESTPISVDIQVGAGTGIWKHSGRQTKRNDFGHCIQTVPSHGRGGSAPGCRQYAVWLRTNCR